MQIVINVDIEALVREEIRNYIRENLIINNVSLTAEAAMDTAIETENSAMQEKVDITIHTGNVPGPVHIGTDPAKPGADKTSMAISTGPTKEEIQWEFAPEKGKRRNLEEIALHKAELKMNRLLTPEEKGKIKAGIEIDTTAEDKAKDDAIKKDKYDKMAQEGLDAASKDTAEEAKTETGPAQPEIKEKPVPSTSDLFSSKPAEVDKPVEKEVSNGTGEPQTPHAPDLGNLSNLFS